MGLEPVSDDVLVPIATELTLPGDTLINDIKLLVQVAGIVVGVASGQPLLVNACLKSLTHDVVSKLAREVIGNVISSTLMPTGPEARDPEGSPFESQVARQATDEFHPAPTPKEKTDTTAGRRTNRKISPSPDLSEVSVRSTRDATGRILPDEGGPVVGDTHDADRRFEDGTEPELGIATIKFEHCLDGDTTGRHPEPERDSRNIDL